MDSFVIGPGYALYEGPMTGGDPHSHAAYQIVIGPAAVVDSAGVRHEGDALVVPPMAKHQMLPAADVRIFYVEPQSAFADRLREWCGGVITEVAELRDLQEERLAGTSGELDPRLVAAMEALRRERIPMPRLAAQVGLSPQRLRALARSQLGMPLASWHTWQCLGRAAQALRAGETLADAAITGGFADQAHFTRRMREMLGLTPSAVLPLLQRTQRSTQ